MADFDEDDGGRYFIVRLLNRFPGVAEWFRLKSALSLDLLHDWRDAIAWNQSRVVVDQLAGHIE